MVQLAGSELLCRLVKEAGDQYEKCLEVNGGYVEK